MYRWKRKNEHIVVLLLLVAVLASFTIITAKIVSSYLNQMVLNNDTTLLSAFEFWVSIIILPVTTIMQVRYLNRVSGLNILTVFKSARYFFLRTYAKLCTCVHDI